jgi:SAM-dependent methyltransferase
MREPPIPFDRLIHEAEAQPFSGWDFSWLDGRRIVGATSWDYAVMARREISAATSMLDLGTGGGEVLATLAPFPRRSAATESYPPNVPIARQRLASLGVDVIQTSEDGRLPFAAESFDLVLDRHEAFDAMEVARVLRTSGVFLTQQVGGDHFAELHDALGAEPYPYRGFDLAKCKAPVDAAGLKIVFASEERPRDEFLDVGAVVYYLRATPWQIPDFSVERYRDRLMELHKKIAREGSLRVRSHKFIIRAVKA